ncbi:uncharacterized protein BCR38DRAFT_476358 [Pseudomassariella vexata]|uniref:Uncharacterized protein n=1 Tax=Pseudomassariella vexata TaxID=1141098 RepID=A0A1Y2DSN4_9PEZI|nr:uncharacterized protein BCR38DRAFT_476358 [Pseudomassariella vexata]ORY61675.1 hypothetical protein BCR38DRAFT_476358 [Pseudomassariella vexata]
MALGSLFTLVLLLAPLALASGPVLVSTSTPSGIAKLTSTVHSTASRTTTQTVRRHTSTSITTEDCESTESSTYNGYTTVPFTSTLTAFLSGAICNPIKTTECTSYTKLVTYTITTEATVDLGPSSTTNYEYSSSTSDGYTFISYPGSTLSFPFPLSIPTPPSIPTSPAKTATPISLSSISTESETEPSVKTTTVTSISKTTVHHSMNETVTVDTCSGVVVSTTVTPLTTATPSSFATIGPATSITGSTSSSSTETGKTISDNSPVSQSGSYSETSISTAFTTSTTSHSITHYTTASSSHSTTSSAIPVTAGSDRFGGEVKGLVGGLAMVMGVMFGLA